MNKIYVVDGAFFILLLIIVAIVRLSDKDDLQVVYGMVGLGIFVVQAFMVFLAFLGVF